MSDELERVRTTISAMEASISRLSLRLDRLERLVEERNDRPSPVRRSAEASVAEASPGREQRSAHTRGRIDEPPLVPVLMGRSMIVLGGAYLLRALTESGAFPVVWGVAAGLGYATVFVALAYAQGADRRASATVHGAMAGIIAMPLAIEMTVRLRELNVAIAYCIILGFALILGTISLRNQLPSLAWIVQIQTIVSLMVLLFGSRTFAAGLWAFLVLSVGSMISARKLSCPALILLPALLGNLLALTLIDLSLVERAPPSAGIGLVSLLAHVAIWSAILVIDSRGPAGRLAPTFIVHFVLVMLFGVGGSLWIALRTELSILFALLLGVITVATGLHAWRTVLRWGDRDPRSVIFVTATTLEVMAITASLLTAAASAITWLALAGAGFLVARSGHRLLYEPVTLLVLGAGFSSGLISRIVQSLLAVPEASSIMPSIAAILTFLASVVFLFAATPPPKGNVFRWLIDAVTTAIVVGASCATAIDTTRLVLSSLGVAIDDLGAIAATRTFVLSIMAIVLAWLTRYPRSGTVASLVYPILVLAAILIMAVNVRVGRAATHFPAFSVYGAALIVAPALRRRSLRIRAERSATPDQGRGEIATPGEEGSWLDVQPGEIRSENG